MELLPACFIAQCAVCSVHMCSRGSGCPLILKYEITQHCSNFVTPWEVWFMASVSYFVGDCDSSCLAKASSSLRRFVRGGYNEVSTGSMTFP